MLTMQNLNAGSWQPLPKANHAGALREVGVYTKFNSDDTIDAWENPVTGEKRPVWNFVGGPC